MVQSFGEYSKTDAALQTKWKLFNQGKSKSTDNSKDLITNSWMRCRSNKTNISTKYAPTSINDFEINMAQIRNKFLINVSMPHLEHLFRTINNINPLITLSDHTGTVLKLISKKNSKVADKVNLLPGASWAETYCGTNGIGTSLIEDKSVSIFGYEHFCESWHQLICTGVPIHDPLMGNQIGVINISGNKNSVFLHNTALIESVGSHIETNIFEHLFFSEESSYKELLNKKQPILIFNKNYVVKYVNNLAMRELGILTEERLQVFSKNEFTSLSHQPIQSQFEDSKGQKWMIKTTPYILMGRVMGRIAIFKKITYSSPNSIKSKISHINGVKSIITQNEEMQILKKKTIQMALNNHPVLINGETGTGKELFAKSIHQHSSRNKEAFITVNCGGFTKDLIASELFGYVKGAFTNANVNGKKGKFELANKGTLFLDEIGELPLDSQTYLLRILEENKVYPIGADKGVSIDIRIVAATNRNLNLAVSNGTFRADLLYRLKVMHLQIPPLRERRADINYIFNHFIKQQNTIISGVKKEVLHLLRMYEWPGNVRELKNICHTAAFNAQFRNSTIIELQDLPKSLISNQKQQTVYSSIKNDKKLTKKALEMALHKARWNKSKASELLGISRTSIYRKIKYFELENFLKNSTI